jgi:hypothetical protein
MLTLSQSGCEGNQMIDSLTLSYEYVLRPQWMPENKDSTEACVCYVHMLCFTMHSYDKV